MSKSKQPKDYIDYREVRPGFTVSLDIVGDRAVIMANAGLIATTWEYYNIIAAQAAWSTWNPLSGVEPQGYAKRRDASSKMTVEVL